MVIPSNPPTKRKRGQNGGKASSSAAASKKKKTGGANVDGGALAWVYRNPLHKERYDLVKDSKFICGRSIDWDALLSTDFGPRIKDYLSRARWLGLANLTRSTFSPQLVWEFYSGIALKSTEIDVDENEFQLETLYTFFNDKDQEITPEFFGSVIGCTGVRGPYWIPREFDVNVVWQEYTGTNEVHDRRSPASSLKTLTLRFLHHFIATTVQCRSGSFNVVTREDLWMLDCLVKGRTINLPEYILNKMKKVLKAKLEASKKPQPFHKKILLPYATVITEIAQKLGWIPKYELQSGAVQYNLGSIGKMGYKEINGVWVKIRRLSARQEEEEEEGANQEEDLQTENVKEDPASSEGQPSNAMLLDLLRRLDHKFDHMIILVNGYGARIGELEQTSRARFDQIEDTLGQIQADIQRMAGSPGTTREHTTSQDLHYYLPAPPLASDPSLQASSPHESF